MSWEQLLSITAEAKAIAQDERHTPPLACPFDGEPLDAAPDGGLFCPWGNYFWPQMRRII